MTSLTLQIFASLPLYPKNHFAVPCPTAKIVVTVAGRLGGRPIRDGVTESRVQDEPTTCIRVLRPYRAIVVGQHAHSLHSVHYPSFEEHHVFDNVYYVALEKTDFQSIAVEVLTKLGDRVPFSYCVKPLVTFLQLRRRNCRIKIHILRTAPLKTDVDLCRLVHMSRKWRERTLSQSLRTLVRRPILRAVAIRHRQLPVRTISSLAASRHPRSSVRRTRTYNPKRKPTIS